MSTHLNPESSVIRQIRMTGAEDGAATLSILETVQMEDGRGAARATIRDSRIVATRELAQSSVIRQVGGFGRARATIRQIRITELRANPLTATVRKSRIVAHATLRTPAAIATRALPYCLSSMLTKSS